MTKKAGVFSESVAEAGLSPARAWYAFFCLPFMNFILLRLLYRWFLWAWLLVRFSRFDLHTVATHPDKAGGLAHLAEPTLAFSLLLAALSAVIAAVWADRCIAEGLRFTAFADEFSIIVLLGEIAAFAPLTAFSGKLVQTRLEGLINYGLLGLRYTRAFQRRWIATRAEDGLLGTSDIQSLADLANSFEVVRTMRVAPITRDAVLGLVVATLAPVAPLALTMMSLEDLLKKLFGVLF